MSVIGIEINRLLWSTAWWVQAQTKSSTDLSITFIVSVHVPIEILHFTWLGKSGRNSVGDLYFIVNHIWVLKHQFEISLANYCFSNLSPQHKKRKGFAWHSKNSGHSPVSAVCIRVRSSCGSHHPTRGRERSWRVSLPDDSYNFCETPALRESCAHRRAAQIIVGFFMLKLGTFLKLKSIIK